MYGHRWTSNYGNEDDGTWRKGLAGLTPEQIGLGLAKCLERRPAPGEEDWPPTLTEFRAMSLPEKMPAYHRDYVSLPRPPRDPELIEKSLASMRNALRTGIGQHQDDATEQAATQGHPEPASASTGNVGGLPA